MNPTNKFSSTFNQWLSQLSDLENKEIFILIILLVFPLLVLLEWINQTKRVNSEVRKISYFTNFKNLIFNNLILALLAVEWFYGVAELKSLALIPLAFGQLGIELYSWIAIGLMILLLDMLIYFWHWLNHRFDFLWNFHRVHHSDNDLNTSTGIRFHLGELVLSLVYKASIILLLGIPVEIMVAFEMITVYAAIFHHSNIRIPAEQWLRYLLVMPIHHATHHSVPRKHHDSNYGVLLSWWDYCFKTFNSHQPQRFGLSGVKISGLKQLIRYGLGAKLSVLTVLIVLVGILTIRWINGV